MSGPASRTAPSGSVRLPVVVLLLALAAGVVPAAAQSLVTSAATVRLRAEPSTSAAILEELPLGTELSAEAAAAEGGWRHVRTAAGRSGWIASFLLRPYTPAARLDVFESIVQARLAREGDGPPTWFQLVEFVERVEGEIEERELAARWAYLRLRALERAARAIPVIYFKHLRPQPFQDWVDANAPLVRYFELGARFGLDFQAVIGVHDRHAGTRAADDIMWLAVLSGIGGECEGWVPCYVNVALMLDGEYLRRYPAGRHVAEAVQRVTRGASYWKADPYQVPAGDCAELAESIARLREVITSVEAPGVPAALAELELVRARCGSAAGRQGRWQP